MDSEFSLFLLPLSFLFCVKNCEQLEISRGTSKSHNMDLVASKSVMTSPLDVAAHIRLLSESLSIIGERLNEHEVNAFGGLLVKSLGGNVTSQKSAVFFQNIVKNQGVF